MPKLALVQMNCAGDRQNNVDRAVEMIREAAARGGQIACLPEIFHDYFFPRDLDGKYFDLAEPVSGPIVERMRRLAQELQMVLVVPIFENAETGVYYNSAVVLDADGSVLGLYRKNHIPMSPNFKEKYYFKPGNLGYPVFRTRYGPLGIIICADRHFPEGTRCLALAGAHLILVPTAAGTVMKPQWEVEIQAHAFFNQCFVGAVNRVGQEGESYYFGRSVVCGPNGEIMVQAGEDEPEVLLAEVDFAQVELARRRSLFFRDRRPETYAPIVDQRAL